VLEGTITLCERISGSQFTINRYPIPEAPALARPKSVILTGAVFVSSNPR
jgi:hypothetical protein